MACRIDRRRQPLVWSVLLGTVVFGGPLVTTTRGEAATAPSITAASGGRMLALNDMPEGWTTREILAAIAPFDCRHLQPAMGRPVRTERVGFVSPSGLSVTERIDVFDDEPTALRARTRLTERLNSCTAATFAVGAETGRFERQPISVQSGPGPGPDSTSAWRESTFGSSPVGEAEYLFLTVSGPTVVSVWVLKKKASQKPCNRSCCCAPCKSSRPAAMYSSANRQLTAK